MGRVEACAHHRLARALAHQADLAARAERQAKRVEQDRFAGPGLAGEYAEAIAEIEVERLDQHDVTNGERGQH